MQSLLVIQAARINIATYHALVEEHAGTLADVMALASIPQPIQDKVNNRVFQSMLEKWTDRDDLEARVRQLPNLDEVEEEMSKHIIGRFMVIIQECAFYWKESITGKWAELELAR